MEDDVTPLGDELVRAVEQLAEAFAARSIRYALIGGVATMMRGRPRFTDDVDILLSVSQITLPGLLQDLSERGFTLDTNVTIQEYIRDHITAFHFGSVKIDWLKPVVPLYDRTLAIASELDWTEGRTVRVASAEGLILTKMIAFRPQDQVDIVALLTANKDTIDVDVIRTEWAPLAPTAVDRTNWLEAEIAHIITHPGKTL